MSLVSTRLTRQLKELSTLGSYQLLLIKLNEGSVRTSTGELNPGATSSANVTPHSKNLLTLFTCSLNLFNFKLCSTSVFFLQNLDHMEINFLLKRLGKLIALGNPCFEELPVTVTVCDISFIIYHSFYSSVSCTLLCFSLIHEPSSVLKISLSQPPTFSNLFALFMLNSADFLLGIHLFI